MSAILIAIYCKCHILEITIASSKYKSNIKKSRLKYFYCGSLLQYVSRLKRTLKKPS